MWILLFSMLASLEATASTTKLIWIEPHHVLRDLESGRFIRLTPPGAAMWARSENPSTGMVELHLSKTGKAKYELVRTGGESLYPVIEMREPLKYFVATPKPEQEEREFIEVINTSRHSVVLSGAPALARQAGLDSGGLLASVSHIVRLDTWGRWQLGGGGALDVDWVPDASLYVARINAAIELRFDDYSLRLQQGFSTLENTDAKVGPRSSAAIWKEFRVDSLWAWGLGAHYTRSKYTRTESRTFSNFGLGVELVYSWPSYY